MLLRVLSDIHGNYQALEAVLTDLAGLGADETLCLGDIVGYGADPGKCIELVREECKAVVCGNHDAGTAGKVSLDSFNWEGATVVRWTKDRLDRSMINWLSGLPYYFWLKDFYMCHSYPANPESWIYVLRRNQALASIEAMDGMISLIGHTHLPGCWLEDGNYTEADSGDFSRVRLVNAGSVGQPRDRDPRAAYLLIDTEAGTWEHRRVEYDIDGAASRIREEGLPEVLAQRLYQGN
jgi:diadenosine tetraphosphatase ApaH/serine/threonine PP2A family protein phosphatase